MIHVCAAVICIRGEFLIASRPPGSHLTGKWEFPGGKIRDHETAYECLVRELKEELGVKIIPLDLIYSVCHAYPEKEVFLEFFRAMPADIADFNPVPHDGQEIKWIRHDKLQTVDWAPADIPLCRLLN